jgi:hypothetical protein
MRLDTYQSETLRMAAQQQLVLELVAQRKDDFVVAFLRRPIDVSAASAPHTPLPRA